MSSFQALRWTLPTSAKELATVWSETLALDALHAGLVTDGRPTGGDTVVTEDQELSMEGARIDFDCYWRKIMQNDHQLGPRCGTNLRFSQLIIIIFFFLCTFCTTLTILLPEINLLHISMAQYGSYLNGDCDTRFYSPWSAPSGRRNHTF